MDFQKVPTCAEMSSWSPPTLIDYFRTCNLKDCEKLVKKQGIDGKRFLEMSESDMQKFPKTRVPMLIRIQQEIIKKEEKRGGFFPLRSETQKGYPSGKIQGAYPLSSHDASMSESRDGTDSDSFDDDYESPDEDYASPAPEDEDSDSSGYELPPSDTNILPINPPPSSNSIYLDKPVPGNPVTHPPNPPQRPFICAPRSTKLPGVQPSLGQDSPRLQKPKSLAPSVDRRTKPNVGKLPSTSGKDLPGHSKAVTLPANLRPAGKPEHLRKPALPSQSVANKSGYPSHTPDADDSPEDNAPWRLNPHHSNTFPSTSPKPSIRIMGSGSNTLPTTDISHSTGPLQAISFPPYKSDNRFSDGSLNGRPPASIPNLPNTSTPGNDGVSSEQWYLGSISRRDAENALRSVNMDGTFLVRNCSETTLSQPYVLMVLYKNKVYNVRIRYDQNSEVYLLGSGGHETFNSVSEIIDYFRKTPLLLIDGKNRGSRQHGKLTCIADRSFL